MAYKKRDKLTLKQKGFIDEVVKTRDPTQSILKVYDVKNRNRVTASSMARENLNKPLIKQTIDQLLIEAGYNPIDSIANLVDIQATNTKRITGSDKIKASELLLKLSGHLIDKHASVKYNFNMDSLDKGQLYDVKNKYDKLKNKRSGKKVPNTQS